MPRRMADAKFRAMQEANRYTSHVGPINELVDRLRSVDRGWVPHVAPLHGGIAAPVLSLLRDPGPATRGDEGSGFLCIENDDPTAERQLLMFESVGISPADITPWNAYPWYINAAPSATQLDAGVAPLLQLMNLMTELEVVFLQGKHAQSSWRRLTRRNPDAARRPRCVITTFHPGWQALFHADPEIRRARAANREAAYREVAVGLGRI